MIRKLLIAILSLTCVLGASFGVAACNTTEREVDPSATEGNGNNHFSKPDPSLSSKLSFELNERGTGYICTGIGTETNKNITIPDSYLNEEINESELPVVAIKEGAFASGKGQEITGVSIGKNVTEIGNIAFSGCSALTSITIPNTVEELGTGVFANCDQLVTVDFGTGIEEIPARSFMNCTSIQKLTFGSNIVAIGDNAFDGCSGINSLTMGTYVRTIGVRAFAGCNGLSSVTLSSRNLQTIGDSAFYNCKGLRDVQITGTEVRQIGFACFQGCDALESITIPFVGYKKYNSVQEFFSVSNSGASDVTEQFGDVEQGDASTCVTSNFGFIFGATTTMENSTNRGYIPLSLTSVKVTGGLVVATNSFMYCDSLKKVEITGVQFLGRTCLGYCKLNYLVLGEELETVKYDIIGLGSLGSLYFRGTSPSKWSDIEIEENSILNGAQRFYYSLNPPATTSGVSYWHYNTNGEPTPW